MLPPRREREPGVVSKGSCEKGLHARKTKDHPTPAPPNPRRILLCVSIFVFLPFFFAPGLVRDFERVPRGDVLSRVQTSDAREFYARG